MFSGGCGDAFRRYASLLSGEIVMATYAESPLAQEVPPGGFSMVLGVANAGEADRVFAGLSEGGEVLMPLRATHWSPRYGIVRDPFGIRWEINCDGEPAA